MEEMCTLLLHILSEFQVWTAKVSHWLINRQQCEVYLCTWWILIILNYILCLINTCRMKGWVSTQSSITSKVKKMVYLEALPVLFVYKTVSVDQTATKKFGAQPLRICSFSVLLVLSPYLQAIVLWTDMFFIVLYTLKSEENFCPFIHVCLASPGRILLICLLVRILNRRFLYLVTGSWVRKWTEKKQRGVIVNNLSRTNACLEQI